MKLKILIQMMNRFLPISNTKEIKNIEAVPMLKYLACSLEELEEAINKIYLKDSLLTCLLFKLNKNNKMFPKLICPDLSLDSLAKYKINSNSIIMFLKMII